MKKLLGGAVVAGCLAFGASLAGTAPAAAQCSDSGVLPCSGLGQSLGGWGGGVSRSVVPPAASNPGAYNPEFSRPRHERRAWRGHRRHGGGYGGWYGGPAYVDRYVPYYAPRPRYYYDDYYYDEEPTYRVNMSAAHIDWCAKRYRTYRVSDNTYKPTRNTRRQCVSPYS